VAALLGLLAGPLVAGFLLTAAGLIGRWLLR
jgi:hypothetical protein